MLGHPGFDLDWNLVRTFVAVARAGSLAAGARSLGITHPTAARHIQQLEEALSMALFSRTTQGLVLNKAGERLDTAAQVMHKSALAFQATSDSLRELPASRVRISVAEILAELLPDLMLCEMGRSEPGQLAIDMVVTDDAVNLLERDADIALRHVRPEQQDLVCRRLGSLAMGVFAHKSYVDSYGLLAAENISQHHFIDGLSRDYFARGAAQRDLPLQEQQFVLRSDSIACQRAAVRAGWGIGAFPLWMVQSEVDWLPVYESEQLIEIEIWLVARPEIRNNEHLQGLFNRLGESLIKRLAPV